MDLATPLPPDEADRLRALHELEVLDTPPEEEFDALVKAAALVCGVPISLVSLVDAERQWFKANVGLPGVSQTARDVAFCAHAILQEGIFEVPDATQDVRFAGNPLVQSNPDIRFYAGAPLKTEDGARIGTLCVIDRQPRALTSGQRETLGHLATAASAALQSRRRARRYRQSEARFRALSEASPLGVFATDADGGCTYTNARWQAIYGLTLAQSLGQGWSRTLHPDDKQAVFAEWQRTAVLGQDFDMSFRVRRDDGSTAEVRCIARPVLADDGRPQGHVGSVEDLSEKRQVQRALVAERNRLAAVSDGTGAGVWEWNVCTGEVRVNARWAETVGWTLAELGELTNQFRVELAHPDELEATRALLREHFGGRSEAYVAEVRLRHRQGHWVWVQDRGRLITRTADGKPEWMFGTHIDISQRKHQETELRHQQELLDRTGRLARVGGWELDVATSELRWSDEASRIHGQAPGFRPQVAAAIDFYAPEARPVIAAAVERAMAEGIPWDLELPLLRADGRRIWVHTVGEVEFQEDRPARIFGAIQDISDRHALDQVLASKTAELKRSNQELERLAYITSHDLQEPLRMVTSYGQLLTRRHRADLKPEAQEFVAYMVEGGQRAQSLIRDLLSLARLDSRAEIWAPVSLEAVLQDCLRPLALRIRETGAQLTHDPLPTVVGDVRQLGQLMTNLLGNALKFRGEEAVRVHVAAAREGTGWRISVRDNGIGIEPCFFDRIFEMFQRLHLRTAYEGTGIGLAICKKVVERHGGHIGVTSAPGQGSCFFFTLPDHAQPARALAANPQAD